MSEVSDIRDEACRLLTPNDTLDVRIFDVRGRMHPEVRESLLKNAHYIIAQTIGNIEGLEVYDICLNGSAAGYFYHQESDIDMRIEVHNLNCPYISNDTLKFNRFLHTILSSFLLKFQFKYNDRSIDVKLTSDQFEIVGLYSILNDKWVIKPDKNMTKGLTLDEIMEEYNIRLEKINKFLSDFEISDDGLTPEKQQELSECYSSLIRNNNISIKDYIVFKLLNYSGVLNRIKVLLSQGIYNYLSVK